LVPVERPEAPLRRLLLLDAIVAAHLASSQHRHAHASVVNVQVLLLIWFSVLLFVIVWIGLREVPARTLGTAVAAFFVLLLKRVEA